MNLQALIHRNMAEHCQQATFLWCPLELRLTAPQHAAWLFLWGHWCLTLNLEPEWEERTVWQWGPVRLNRPETAAEEEERLEGWAEEAFMERELHRYTEWGY